MTAFGTRPADPSREPPSPAEAQATARAVAHAAAPPGGPTRLQRMLLEAVYPAMTGHAVDLDGAPPVPPAELAHVLRHRDQQFRTRGVQLMLLCALTLRPLPPEVAERVAGYARALGVDEGMIDVARGFAAGALGLAGVDFERNGYTGEWHPDDAAVLHTSGELSSAWDLAADDPALAARWTALAGLPAGTLGREVWELYDARGFVVPGLPGSAPPLLAQHDWVHVLADYGTTVEAELEVFALIARANDDMRGFSLLAMVISLFETGYLSTGAGLFEASPGHLSRDLGLATRIADAMRRGALARDEAAGHDSVDLLRIDWFALADRPLDEVRARFRILPPSAAALAAGSVGPRDPAGISDFQREAGRRVRAGRGGRAVR